MSGGLCTTANSWRLDFLAEPAEVPALRRLIRLQLAAWGLPERADIGELCVSELVSNVIKHVGPGTPTTLAVAMTGGRLRIAVRDPADGALPVLADANNEAESGRGLALVAALVDRWGVEPDPSGKTTWCEVSTGTAVPPCRRGGRRTDRAEAVLLLYGAGSLPGAEGASPLATRVAEESAISLIADLLHWLRGNGWDSDDVIDRAQTRFEATLERASAAC
ncbi:ATP-binding protein [Streptomyces zingiberis]|uniref:ATP-binding protein n=1 Tax=Streptomyces zingiberis TaxID=2053010 RepID=A0ABX1BZF2_9ACTN|nr:ATP-binding protein [Streptomyces zingiberis]NJQ01871.1 ATP-binding protein [Streptomyces zingiberis]